MRRRTSESGKREVTQNVRREAALAAWWCRRLLLCIIVAATPVMSPAQNEHSSSSVRFTTLVNFDGTNGWYPSGSLVQGTDGNLYGTTFLGGLNIDCFGSSCGTVFKVSPNGTLTTLYNFCSETNCADGGNPAGPLVLGTDGNFYGITEFGGTGAYCPFFSACGTVFKITPGGVLTTLYNWCSQPGCVDGTYTSTPVQGTFVQAIDGNFYGATEGGGSGPFDGTIFKLTPEGALTTLYSFCSQSSCPDGQLPSGLIQASDGNFYGTTEAGGANSSGTVFKVTPTGMLTTVYNFCSQTNCTDGGVPFALIAIGLAIESVIYSISASWAKNCWRMN